MVLAIAPPSLSGYSYNNCSSFKGRAPIPYHKFGLRGRDRDPIDNEMVLAIAPPSLSGYSYNNYNSLGRAPIPYHKFGRDPIANEMVVQLGYRTSSQGG